MSTDSKILEISNDIADKVAGLLNRFTAGPRDPEAFRELCRELSAHAEDASNMRLHGLAAMIRHHDVMYREWYFVNFKSPMP